MKVHQFHLTPRLCHCSTPQCVTPTYALSPPVQVTIDLPIPFFLFLYGRLCRMLTMIHPAGSVAVILPDTFPSNSVVVVELTATIVRTLQFIVSSHFFFQNDGSKQSTLSASSTLTLPTKVSLPLSRYSLTLARPYSFFLGLLRSTDQFNDDDSRDLARFFSEGTRGLFMRLSFATSFLF